MSIVTISRGSFSMGKAVAQRVAERLGYQCVSRDVLLEASDRYNTPAIRLEQAIRDAPSWIERLTQGKKAYIAYIQAALTRYAVQDDIVYHGLAGHLLLKNVAQVLKVRIIADMDLRVRTFMEREGCTERQALAQIAALDDHRRRWTQALYGVDPSDPTLYDLVLRLPAFSEDEAADLVCQAVAKQGFQSTDESRQAMRDLALACAVKAALIDDHPDISVGAVYGNVLIYCGPGDRRERSVKASAEAIRDQFEGLGHLEVHAGVSPPPSAV